MINKIINRFIKNKDNVTDKNVREHYTVLCGVLGIICNVFLFGVKLVIGLILNSIAIMGDAINNLSDTGSCFVAIIGAKLSNQKPDAEHPYGHGRIEYISSLIVSFFIIIVGVELFKSSLKKIIHPEEVKFNLILIIILAVSMLVKLWMYSYNKYVGKKINSDVLLANSKDSINDVLSTSGIIIATIFASFISFPIDGIIGLIVSLIIVYGGFSIARETVGTLLGKSAEKDLVKKIENELISADSIIGVHDLMVHDYGPGRIFASVHAEVPADADIIHAHEIIDGLEKKVKSELNIELVIHMDPIVINDDKINEMKALIKGIVESENKNFSIHDFRMTDGEKNVNLIFDLVVDFKTTESEKNCIIEKITKRVKEVDDKYSLVITVENSYV